MYPRVLNGFWWRVVASHLDGKGITIGCTMISGRMRLCFADYMKFIYGIQYRMDMKEIRLGTCSIVEGQEN